MIPIAKPMIGEEEKSAVIRVLDSGMLAQGSEVKRFEEQFAEYIGTKFAVATSSGTTALHLALLACGVEKGDEVITTPFTFISTVNSILFCSAKPVFIDIEHDTFNINPEKIEDGVTERTKAILPVHLYGQPAKMDLILEIAERHNLKVIEDAAQAHGAELEGRKVGTFGDVACFSFYPTKNITTGEGGIVTTNNEEIAERVRLLRNHGQKSRYEYAMIGYNFRMTDVAAVMGIEQLKKLESFVNRRIENARFLSENLNGVSIPYVMPDVRHAFHQYTVMHDRRDELRERLIKEGIGCAIYYPKCAHQHNHLKKYRNSELRIAEGIAKKVLSIPVHPGLSREDLEKIVESVNKHCKEL